jgi:hypothetical protein
MKNKIVTVDIVIMVIIIFLAPFIFSHYFSYFKYFIFLMYLYTFLKSIFGNVILFFGINKKIKLKNIVKENLYILVPSFIVVFLYACLMSVVYIYLLLFENMSWKLLFLIPISMGFNQWFPGMNGNIFFNIIITIGIFSWLIFLTINKKNTQKQYTKLAILSIITPIYSVTTFFIIMMSFTT